VASLWARFQLTNNMNLVPPKLTTPIAPRRPQNAIVEIILIGGLVFFMTWFLILPKFSEVKKQQELHTKAKIQLASLNADYDKLSVLTAQLSKQKRELALMDEILPTDARLTKFYLIGEDLAVRSGMSVISVNVTKGSVPTAVQKTMAPNGRTVAAMDIQYNLNGNVEQLVDFLRRLKGSMRIFDLDNIDLTSDKDGNLNIKAIVKTYYYPVPGTEQ